MAILLGYTIGMLTMTVPVDNFGTVVGENPDCLLLSGTVVGENPDHVCWGPIHVYIVAC